MIISEKIFLILEQKRMSQKDFAERTGISQSTISDWKRKRTNPSADKILKICEVLQVTPYELLAEDMSGTGGGSSQLPPVNQEEAALLVSYRGLDQRQKQRVIGYLYALKETDGPS